jgi:two-component system, chemotaxis family, response regulator Rcp1
MNTPELRILLVEDNSGDALLFRRAVARENAAVEVVHVMTGEAALQRLSDDRQPVDLIFLDLNLPGMSGFDVLGHLKSELTLRSIPVVVLSSSNARDDINDSYKAFASVYMVKPSDLAGYEKLARFIIDCWFGMAQLPNAG